MKYPWRKPSSSTAESCALFVRTGKQQLEHFVVAKAVQQAVVGLLPPEQAEASLKKVESITGALHDEMEQLFRKGGCGVEFQVGEGAVRAVCIIQDCPFYPDGPDHIS